MISHHDSITQVDAGYIAYFHGMKIICIGRNYAAHAAEMKSDLPREPMVFMKPSTALLVNNKPLYLPEWTSNVHHEVEVVLKIGRNGRYVQPEFADGYIAGIALGLDFTARDLQQRCKEKGHPWEIAKAWDNSAAVSEFVPYESGKAITFSLQKNQETVQSGSTDDMIFDFTAIICHVSQYFKLQVGDYIYTGTPSGVGKVDIGDTLEAYLGDRKMLHCDIK